MKPIYLDHSATTPVSDHVFLAMRPYFEDAFGNPSSLYEIGAAAKRTINNARKAIAMTLNADPTSIYFTSGGTEATNFAIKGLAFKNPHLKEILTTPIEHHATLHACEFMETLGRKTVYIPVDSEGMIDLEALDRLIKKETLMVSIIHGNNEIGTIQDLEKIAAITKKHNVLLHVDAVQSFSHVPIDLDALKIDCLTLSAHKFYGPKGIGLLYIRNGLLITPLIHGGAQEMKHRAGTENVPYIVGMAEAMKSAHLDMTSHVTSLRARADRLYQMIKIRFPSVRLNGPMIGDTRLPGHLSLSFPDINGFELAFQLNRLGVYVSTGSACSASSMLPSHVLKAIGVPSDYINGTIRMTLGLKTSDADIDDVVERLVQAMDAL